MFNNISSTSCLLVDTSSFDRLFMCKLYRKNKWHKIYLCITLKKIEIMVIIIYIIIIMIIIITILIIKLEDAYLLYLIFWVKLFEYCIWFKIHIFLSFQQSNNLSLWRGFSLSSKKNLFHCNFDYINTFLSKSIRETLYKPYKVIMYSKGSVNIG